MKEQFELDGAMYRIQRSVDLSRQGSRETLTQRLAANNSLLVAKIAEESLEVQQAYLYESIERFIDESADVMYPLAVGLAKRGSSLIAPLGVLARRGVVQ